MPWAVKIIAVIVVIVGYLISLHIHPHHTCRGCGGTGIRRGAVFAFAHRRCGTCGGQARHRRWGNMLFSPTRPTRAEIARGGAAPEDRPMP